MTGAYQKTEVVRATSGMDGWFESLTLAREAAREPVQLPATRAWTLRVGFFGNRRVAAADTDETLLTSPEHGPEVAAQYTVGAAYSVLQHSFLHSFSFD